MDASVSVPAELLALLACPADDHGRLEPRADRLACTACGRTYPVEDGIPVLLLDRARLPADGDPC